MLYVLTDQRNQKPLFIARTKKEVETRKKDLSGNHYVIEQMTSSEFDARMGLHDGHRSIRAKV